MYKTVNNTVVQVHKIIGGRIKISKKVYKFLFPGADGNDNNKIKINPRDDGVRSVVRSACVLGVRYDDDDRNSEPASAKPVVEVDDDRGSPRYRVPAAAADHQPYDDVDDGGPDTPENSIRTHVPPPSTIIILHYVVADAAVVRRREVVASAVVCHGTLPEPRGRECALFAILPFVFARNSRKTFLRHESFLLVGGCKTKFVLPSRVIAYRAYNIILLHIGRWKREKNEMDEKKKKRL
ncbi:hypothetical protein QTP88_007375 [Uroleucon formosanum]